MTHDDKKKIHAALSAPFPEHCVQRTEGHVTGRGYDTAGIGYQHIVNRLNEVLGIGGWRTHRSVTVRKLTTAKGREVFEAICDITLELGEWIEGAFVAFADALADGGHTSISEADARKGAYTNALKKAAAMFGAGRQAYEGTLDDDNVPAEGAQVQAAIRRRAPDSAEAQPVGQELSRQVQPLPQRNRLTSKQLTAIWAIGRKLGLEQRDLRTRAKSQFNSQPEFLTRDQASALIGELARAAGNGHEQPGTGG